MGRAPCCDKDGLRKGPWMPEEDRKLTVYIQKHGLGSWRSLPKNAGLSRCGKSCRLRWMNYLRPDIKRGGFSFEEEEMIMQLHRLLGNKWSTIAARLPGRTDNEIKNYWNTHMKKRLLKMGIDPVTHAPRLDFLDLSSLLPYIFNPTGQLEHLSYVNKELINVAANLLGGRDLYPPTDALSQELLKNYNLHQVQGELLFPSFLNQQLQEPMPAEVPICCTTSSNAAGFLGGGGGGQFQSQTNPCQTTDALIPCNDLSNIDHCGFNPGHQFKIQPVANTMRFDPNNGNIRSAEDERDMYCSNGMVMGFQIPELLDVSELMLTN